MRTQYFLTQLNVRQHRGMGQPPCANEKVYIIVVILPVKNENSVLPFPHDQFCQTGREASRFPPHGLSHHLLFSFYVHNQLSPVGKIKQESVGKGINLIYCSLYTYF